ncbi:cytochrome c oxidase assembly protein [Mesorhizobium sp.]|uniref:cytochrome c oxidase assembly protein n=1 Tax=Mesorhizobium sp. TaxID=1871066 RepID=UPI00120A2447|nr:cytochrome c oxidase assembly protein [Mesorhizobium sp.]TIT04189.1 MAG: cytochrome c oxidase assembly protein [Mesorhizobium sp.]
MRTLTTIVLLLMSASPMAAHDGDAHGSALVWTFDPWIVVPIAVAGGLYAAGSFRLSQRSNNRRFPIRSAGAFWVGWIMLAAALISPLHYLGEHLFTFHMVEHELVMAVSAPLFVLARPIGVLLWGQPRSIRRLVRNAVKTALVGKAWDALSTGPGATLLHGFAIWIWHVPALFDAAVSDITLHRLQHLSFFVTAVLFWWAMVWRSDRGFASCHLFLTMLHTSVLGALIALAPRAIYMVQTRAADDWGLTPLEDQQLAGILMWMPGGIIYAGAALTMLALWIVNSGKGDLDASRFPSP